MSEPVLGRITVFPVKSLDPLSRERVRIVEGGSLAGDREFALFDADGEYVNGKRNAAVHRVRSSFDPETREIRVRAPDCPTRTFDVDDDAARAALAGWFGDHFGEPVELRRDAAGGFPDDRTAHGPTVVGDGTLREVASWFPEIDAGEVRRRLRPNLVIEGVPPFWEDRLFEDRDHVVAFEVGGVRLYGVNPCSRCVVPTRDPTTGVSIEGFRETFVRKHRETMPSWSGGDWFDHDYRLMVNTVVPDSERGRELSIGDPIELVGVRSADAV
ncbi:MAG: MOSC domain-containing protein [Salinigranum sp.]